jgi:hypothetical protein
MMADVADLAELVLAHDPVGDIAALVLTKPA